jgi:DNA-binding transcriptional ArsR family regulator
MSRTLALPPRPTRAKALRLFQAIAHADRLDVLLALSAAPRCVSELADVCQASPSAMSHQLRRLREAGLVRTSRRGRHVEYALADRHVAKIVGDAVAHAAESPPRRSAKPRVTRA